MLRNFLLGFLGIFGIRSSITFTDGDLGKNFQRVEQDIMSAFKKLKKEYEGK